MRNSMAFVLVVMMMILVVTHRAKAFGTTSGNNRRVENTQDQQQQQQQQPPAALPLQTFLDSSSPDGSVSRRRMIFTSTTAATASMGLFAALGIPLPSRAADASDSSQATTIYLTGKQPKGPGIKPRDKSDVNGSRKDPRFLRSLSDCKNQCENSAVSDGLARSKEDCLSECQDICCSTYEQCTFAIVPRI